MAVKERRRIVDSGKLSADGVMLRSSRSTQKDILIRADQLISREQIGEVKDPVRCEIQCFYWAKFLSPTTRAYLVIPIITEVSIKSCKRFLQLRVELPLGVCFLVFFLKSTYLV